MINTMLGTKLGMTQVFPGIGEVIPVTVLKVGPCVVVQKKSLANDGYNALQLGYGQKREKLINKAMQGHLKKVNLTSTKYLREVKIDNIDEYQPGDKLGINMFKKGDYVDIKGISKGKGMAGVIKRHHFKGGKNSHGCDNKRGPGSVGASSYPSRVFKGMRMAGHMGCDMVKVLKLEIVEVRENENLLLVKGAVPGPRNGFVVISKTNRFVKVKIEKKAEVKDNKETKKESKKKEKS